VALVERGDVGRVVALGERYHGCVDDSQRKIFVLLRQLCDTSPFTIVHRFDDDLAGGDRVREGDLRVGTDTVGT
jgi:hypothetical protein